MYNPSYLERPYIVVLNKIDLPEVPAVYLKLMPPSCCIVNFPLLIFSNHSYSGFHIVQARNRFPSLAQQVSSIGCNVLQSVSDSLHIEKTSAISEEDNGPLESSIREKKEKEIGEYPRPLAVVGVSLLYVFFNYACHLLFGHFRFDPFLCCHSLKWDCWKLIFLSFI